MAHRVYLLLTMTFLILLVSCGQRITQTVIDNAPVTVGPRGTEIRLTHAVVADWSCQVIRTEVATHFSLSTDPWGLKLDDGSVVVPEVDLTSDSGKEYSFKLTRFRNTDVVDFENDGIERKTRFVRVEMRSAEPVVLSSVTWISYMPQDTKTGSP